MFERFTDRARRVVVLAQEDARMLKHHYIGSEHLLLGLAAEGEGIAAQAFKAAGIEPEELRAAVTRVLVEGDTPPGGHIPFTVETKKILEQSLREALQLGHPYIGTEHLLLGWMRAPEDSMIEVLDELGTTPDLMRDHVIRLLVGYQEDRAKPSVYAGPKTGVVGGSSSAPMKVIEENPGKRLTALTFQADQDANKAVPQGARIVRVHHTVTVTSTIEYELAED